MPTAYFQKPATVVPHLDGFIVFLQNDLATPAPPNPTPTTRTQLRSNVTAARRLFFNVYHASFQHPPLAELGLTALVEAWRSAGLQGRLYETSTRSPPEVPGNRNTRRPPVRNSSRGAVEPGLDPRSRFTTCG